MNSTHDQTRPCEFGLKSTNVMLEQHHEPVNAIILIKDGKIYDVKILSELDAESVNTLYKEWHIEDYGNLLIFPGIIDSNVHLHSGYNSEWDNIPYATTLAAMGGVTTVIDNPIMTKPFETGQDYLKVLEERLKTLQAESQVDFGLYGLLEKRTQDHIAQILKLGVVGLKCYLLSCFQHNIGYVEPEGLAQLFETLNNDYPGLLLAFHPEIATDRELYHSSPCRALPKEKRLDLDLEILPLELGGAANKGSFLDDFKEAKKGSDDLDDEFDSADINTPSKLRPQIKKSKEKAEVNNIAYFELLSYGGSEQKAKSNESSAESDDEFNSNQQEETKSEGGTGSEKLKIPLVFAEEGQKAKKTFASSLNREEKILEVDSDENGMTPTPNRLTAQIDSSLKKSFFAPKIVSNEEEVKVPEIVVGILKTPKTLDELDKEKGDLSSRFRSKEGKKVVKTSFDVSSPSEKSSRSRGSESPAGDYTPVEKKPDMSIDSDNNPQEVKRFATRVALFTAKSSTEITGGYSERPTTTNDTSDEKADSQEIPKFKKKLEIDTQFEENSPGPRKNSSNSSLSPVKRTLTPSSSLLNRRMSRKISGNFLPPSTKSNASSPDSDLSRVSFLDINKSPDNYKRTQGLYNSSYRVFLANRSLGWEENGLSTIIKAMPAKANTLRILVQNLSLASSFYKIRLEKKASEQFSANFYGDSGIAYLVFSEKAVKKGDTKYKAAPPLREKENRRLLVENFRLRGIDILSSYHFYVPPRFKNIEDGNFRRAFNGFNVIGFTLQAVWTVLYNYYNNKSKKFSEDLMYQKKIISDILRKIFEALCLNPAKMLKIDHRKGTIAKGKDADFVIWDPSKCTKALDLHPSHLFCDKTVLGVVHKTILRGKVIYDKDKVQVQSERQNVEFISPRP